MKFAQVCENVSLAALALIAVSAAVACCGFVAVVWKHLLA